MTNVQEELGTALLQRARNAIAKELGIAPSPEAFHVALLKPGASFVTLSKQGELRGCIGTLEAVRPLDQDVRANASAAAFRDPRFAPLTRDEFDEIIVEVSLLSPAEPIEFNSETDALSQLRPHVDGVILQYQKQRATFLPQVWDQLYEPQLFMTQLKTKAGLPFDFWSPEIKLYRYEVRKWKETPKN